MPLLHRLACFRDDVVFLILREVLPTLHSRNLRTHKLRLGFTVYQMWIYKVDPTRENEYGELFWQGPACSLRGSTVAHADLSVASQAKSCRRRRPKSFCSSRTPTKPTSRRKRRARRRTSRRSRRRRKTSDERHGRLIVVSCRTILVISLWVFSGGCVCRCGRNYRML